MAETIGARHHLEFPIVRSIETSRPVWQVYWNLGLPELDASKKPRRVFLKVRNGPWLVPFAFSFAMPTDKGSIILTKTNNWVSF